MNTIKIMMVLAISLIISCSGHTQKTNTSNDMKFKVEKTEEEWKKQLDEDAYRVLRQKGTERPYTGKYYYQNDTGVYVCGGCQAPLFTSETKFDAGCGWPSFYQPVSPNAIIEIRDLSHGMVRTEVICAACGGHLGHVFNDAPDQPTGLRYCINSISLDFDKK